MYKYKALVLTCTPLHVAISVLHVCTNNYWIRTLSSISTATILSLSISLKMNRHLLYVLRYIGLHYMTSTGLWLKGQINTLFKCVTCATDVQVCAMYYTCSICYIESVKQYYLLTKQHLTSVK